MTRSRPSTPRQPAPGPSEASPEAATRGRYRAERTAHWDAIARGSDRWQGLGRAYHRRLERIYRSSIPPGRRVLEVGCGLGDLLASVAPAYGVGVDFSAEMIRRAGPRHPELHFVECEASEVGRIGETFDFIILSDLINDLWDVQDVLGEIRSLSMPRTRVILNFYSRLWGAPVVAAQSLGLARPVLPQNWLTVPDVKNLLVLADLEAIRNWEEVLLPLPIPLLAPLANRVLVRLWPAKYLALSNFVVARPVPERNARGEESVSV
ncbi:MAG: class I SAM-dependent methyltransferase, partial [Candidatus Binatia bacterium]